MRIFYVERIDLTSKLRKSDQKWQWSRPFSSKKSPRKFSDNDPSKSLLAGLRTVFSAEACGNW